MQVQTILDNKNNVLTFLKEKGFEEEKNYPEEEYTGGNYFKIDKSKLLVVYEATEENLKEIKDHFLIDRGLSYCLIIIDKKLIFFRTFGEPKYFLYSERTKDNISKIDRLSKIDSEGFDFIFQAGRDVSGVFYDSFKIKRDILVQHIESKAEPIQKYLWAQKIFDRVFFIYFLCHKGIIKVNNKQISGKNLFEILLKEKDFFQALTSVFQKFNSTESGRILKLTDYMLHIPYLNGGLFRIEKSEENLNIALKNSQWAEIFDFLNSFHWIIEDIKVIEDDEDKILTPEILGHVYERSVVEWESGGLQKEAEAAVKNVTERKKKGVYYTPEAITEYISNNSIMPYLMEKLENKYTSFDALIKSNNRIDENFALKILDEIKVLDPACGSGAFLIKISEALFNLKKRLNYVIKSGKSAYDLKLDIITENIYGVDILTGAIEISKLRLWLWLISNYEENKNEINALPNIEYNLRVGNSLVGWLKEKSVQGPIAAPLTPEVNGIFIGLDLHYKGVDKEELDRAKKYLGEYSSRAFDGYIEAYYLIYKLYRRAHGHEAVCLRTILETIRNYIYESITPVFLKYMNKNEKLRNGKNLPIKLDELKKLQVFHWQIDFGHIIMNGGFDIIVSNPPYVKEYVNRAAFDGLRQSNYYQGKMDLWYFFACRSIDLLKGNGILTFIAQNNWITSFGASIMRNKVITETKILKLLDFSDYKIFDTADIQTMIMFFQKDGISDGYSFDYRRINSEQAQFKDVMDLLNYKETPHVEYFTPVIKRNELYDKQLTFNNSIYETILNKIASKRNFELDEKKEVAAGIDVHQDHVIKSHLETAPKLNLGDGIFIISDKELEKMKLSHKELSIIKPFYTTDNLGKYVKRSNNTQWVIYTTTDIIKKINDFPKIKAHLDRFKNIITSDSAPYGLHRARNEYFFKGEKIISVRKCKEPTFTYTDFDCYVSVTFYVIKTDRVNQKYLTSLLNSRLMAFWLKQKGKMQGNNCQIDKEPLLSLPIRIAPADEQKQIIELFDRFEKLLKQNGRFDSQKANEIQNQIDRVVYKIYDLNVDEIVAIEHKMKID